MYLFVKFTEPTAKSNYGPPLSEDLFVFSLGRWFQVRTTMNGGYHVTILNPFNPNPPHGSYIHRPHIPNPQALSRPESPSQPAITRKIK